MLRMMEENRRKYVGFLSLLMPVISYLLFEYVTGNAAKIPPAMAVLNVMWFAVFYLAVFVLSGTTRIAIPVVSVLIYVVSVAEAFVVSFRSTPIMIWDILAFSTAMTVAEHYAYQVSAEMVLAGVGLVLMNLFFWFFPLQVKGWKRRLLLGGSGACALAGLVMFFYMKIVPSKMLDINMWAMNDTYEQCGYVLSTMISLKYVVKTPPKGYSLTKVRKLGEDFLEDPAGENSSEAIQPVNLICIMNESLSELKTAGDFTTNQEYFPFLNSLTENTVRGSLCVPVFGAMTSNTEFEFLVSDSMAMLPFGSVAYQFYVKPGVCSLVSVLKDQGYYSVALHTYPRENWNRDRCYENMGFDEFLDMDSFEGSPMLRSYYSDMADYQKIIQTVEGKETPEDKLFIFDVTMQNHGGYDQLYDNFQQEIFLTGSCEGKYPKADQYLSLMRVSDDAFRQLVEYFTACPEPTMIVLFGDHQPGVEDEFFDEIAGRPSYEVEDPDRLMWYQTPFVIWTNYQQPSKDMGKMGSVYLSAHMLRLANLEMSPFHHFLLTMWESLPVVHPMGLYEGDGTYYSWFRAESPDCPYQEMVMDYEYLVYNHSLDGRTVTQVFSIP